MRYLLKRNRKGADLLELAGTKLRTTYPKKGWTVRHVALTNIGVKNIDVCKTDEFFTLVVGCTPSQFLIYTERGELHLIPATDDIHVCLFYSVQTQKKKLRMLNVVNFTFVMENVLEGKQAFSSDVVRNFFKRVENYVNTPAAHDMQSI